VSAGAAAHPACPCIVAALSASGLATLTAGARTARREAKVGVAARPATIVTEALDTGRTLTAATLLTDLTQRLTFTALTLDLEGTLGRVGTLHRPLAARARAARPRDGTAIPAFVTAGAALIPPCISRRSARVGPAAPGAISARARL
jgi:hypothetical protein